MTTKKIDLIVHPVRLRVLQAIGNEKVSTQAIADRLPDIPKSSIYRHLKLLLEGGFVVVVETKQVRGTVEKFYQLAQRPHLGAGEIAGLTAADHLHYFNIYLMTLQQEFANYLQRAETVVNGIDFLQDKVGYTEVSVFASNAELDSFFATVNAALQELLQNAPGNGRRRHKIATVTHPLKAKLDTDRDKHR